MDVNLSSVTKAAPCWGAQICAENGWSFDEVFRTQFRISRTRAISSPNWIARQIGTFWIEHCPHLPVSEVHNRRGQPIGWCLGVAVDQNGTTYGAPNGPALKLAATFDVVERRQSQLAGRFALVVKIGDEIRYYPDAVSALTAVMDKSAGTIASTVPLAISDEVQPSNGRTLDEMQSKPTLYLMGETIDARVSQLLGNHYINMRDFSAHRFWPRDDTPFEPHERPVKTARGMAENLRAIMSGLAANFECTLPITGGQDSRLLAGALLPESVPKIRNFHVHHVNWASRFDVPSAQQVAAHLDLPLIVKSVRHGGCDAELADVDMEVARAQAALATGYAHPCLSNSVLQAINIAPESFLLLRGGAAEMTRANKWPSASRVPKVVSAEFAFERLVGQNQSSLRNQLGDQIADRYWRKYERWFDDLPASARGCAPDVQHMELWLAAGVGAAFFASRRHFYVNPFSSLRLLHQTMRFEPGFRKRSQLLKLMFDFLSPGLAEVPLARELISEARSA